MSNQLLSTISFSGVSKWYVEYYLKNQSVKSNYPLVKLRKIIKPIKRKIKKNDYDGKLPLVSKIVFSTGEIVFRDEKKTGMDLLIVKQGDLLVSNINFHQGAVAYNSIGDFACSTHYQTYTINANIILPQYLIAVLRSDTFINIVSGVKANGIKNESGYNFIGDFDIPLPSITEQQALLDAYDASMQKAINAERECQKTKDCIDGYLLDSLGIQINQIKTNSNKLIFVSRLRDISRWDMWTQRSEYVTTKYRFSKFGSVVLGKPLYGANEKAVKEKSDVRYLRITDINEDGSLGDEFVSAKKVEEKYLLENNDFLIARSGNTVGKTFLYKSEIGKCIFAGYLVRYKLNESKILPDYLLEYTKSSIFKSWISNNQRIFGQPNINGQEYLNADIVIPSLEIQKEIVENIKSMRLSIRALCKEAESLRQRAKKEFEIAVFG